MHNIYSTHVSESIKIKDIKSNIKGTLLSETISELFYKTGENKYLSIYNYGALSFSNYTTSEIDSILNEVRDKDFIPTSEEISIDLYDPEEDEEENFSFDSNILYVPKDMFKHKDMFRIVMFNLSQTVTMDYYTTISDTLLNNTKSLTKELELKGSVKISKVNMMKFIGKSLNAKTNIVDTLYIFDSPDITWDNETIDDLHKFLTHVFDLKARFRELEYSFKIIDDNLQVIKDIYQHKESYVMETIVIILILIEVIKDFVAK